MTRARVSLTSALLGVPLARSANLALAGSHHARNGVIIVGREAQVDLLASVGGHLAETIANKSPSSVTVQDG